MDLSLVIEASQHKRSPSTHLLARLVAVVFSATEMPGAASTSQMPNPGDTCVSKKQQEQIGRQAVGEIYKQMPVLPDSSAETRYVRQLGQMLAGVIPQQYSWPEKAAVRSWEDQRSAAMETPVAIAMTVNQAGASIRNLAFPRNRPKRSFKMVLERIPMAMASAAIAIGICPSALFAIEIVRASISVKPRSAPDNSNPASPQWERTT